MSEVIKADSFSSTTLSYVRPCVLPFSDLLGDDRCLTSISLPTCTYTLNICKTITNYCMGSIIPVTLHNLFTENAAYSFSVVGNGVE